MKRKEERSWTPKSVAQGIITIIVGIWFLWFIGWSNSIAYGGGYEKPDKEIEVCYDGHIKTIDKHDLRKWIKKGATEGPCQTTTTTYPDASTTTMVEETTTTVEVEESTTTTVVEGSCVDLNTANENELTSVSGVSTSMAMAIIAATTFGPDGGASPFPSVFEAQLVIGFGDDALAPQAGFPGFFSDDCLTVVQATTTTSTTMPSEATTTTVVATTTTVDPRSTLPMTGGREIGLGVAAGCVLIGSGALVLLLWDKKKRQEEQSYLDFDE